MLHIHSITARLSTKEVLAYRSTVLYTILHIYLFEFKGDALAFIFSCSTKREKSPILRQIPDFLPSGHTFSGLTGNIIPSCGLIMINN